MNPFFKKFCLFALLAVLAAAALAAGNRQGGERLYAAETAYTVSPDVSPTPAERLPVRAIALDPGELTIEVGATADLRTSVDPDGAVPFATTWQSTNSTVARVSANPADAGKGIVTAVYPGVARITCTMDDVVSTTTLVNVSGVDLGVHELTMYVGSSRTLTRTVYGNASTVLAANWQWSSSDTTVARVDPVSGVVTAQKEGSAYITCSTLSGPSYADACRIIVTMDETATIRRTLTEDALRFSTLLDEIDAICLSATDEDLNYLTGITASTRQATIYEGWISEANPGTGVASGGRYYRTNNERLIENLYLVPKNGFTGVCDVSFTGYSVGGKYFTGNIVVTVPSNTSSIVYNSRQGAAVRMARDDFTGFCKRLTSRDLRHVVFELPEERYGKLQYYRMDNGLYESAVKKDTRYYPYASPSIDDVYFVPRAGFTGSLYIFFKGEDNSGGEFYGSVHIVVGDNGSFKSDEISYSVVSGQDLKLNYTDFSQASYAATGTQLNYIRFSKVPSDVSQGVLYQGDGAKAATTVNYYLTASGSRQSIEGLLFRSAAGYTGTFTLDFTGVNAWNESFTGKLRITVTSSNNADVSYSIQAGKELVFSAADFSRASFAATGNELSYILFNSLPASSQGTLYVSGTAVNNTANAYYRTGSTRTLGTVAFVAAPLFTGVVTIPYSGRSEKNESFDGNIRISVGAAASAGSTGTVGYYSSGVSARLLASDFTNAARNHVSGTLSYIRFTAPPAEQGRLCANYVSPTQYELIVSGRDYAVSELNNIAFQPHAGFRGTASIPYVLSTTGGSTFTGTVTVLIEPLTSSSVFADMGSYSWAVQAVDFLQSYGILNGTSASAFSPGDLTRRCDYVLMLSRAFNFPYAGVDSFTDVAQDSYYAAAVASAKSLGIASGDERGRFRPNNTVTRQDAAVLLYRALQNSQAASVPAGSYTDLARFTDRGQVADYAVVPLASLVRLGVFNGDDQYRLNPRSPLSRAEMAAIFYRAIT